jgi:peptide/nickel transport system permease protein
VRLLTGIFVLRSMPAFWLAMIFVSLFAVQIHLFPVTGARTIPILRDPLDYTLDVIRHAVLPILVLTLTTLPITFVVMRYAMLSVLGADYLRTARAKGLTERAVLMKHALRNALLPVITVFTLNLGFAISGATVIETVFNYPGIGRTMFDAVLRRDYPLLQGGFLILTIGVLATNLLADFLYPRFDPRLRGRM